MGQAVRESLTKRGLIVTRDAPATVSGEILCWHADLKPEMNKSVDSRAEIYVEVLNDEGRRIFDGNYSGEQSIVEPIVSERDLDRSLGGAMQQAVAQLVEDRDLLKALWRNAEGKYPGRMKRTPPEIR